MKAVTLICHAVVGAIIFSAAAGGAADKQQDRLQLHIDDPQYLQDQDQDQDRLRIHQDEQQYNQLRLREGNPIYGAELMTVDELTEYQNQYQKLQTAEEQNRFENQHRLLIKTRAQAEGVDIPTETAAQVQNKAGAAVNNQASRSTMSGNGNSGSTGGGQGGNSQSSGGGAGSGNGGGGGGGSKR